MAEGLVEKNPLRSPRRARHRGGSRHEFIDLQPSRRPPRLLEPIEALSLLDATPPQFVDLVLAGLTTGFRRNELLGLRWEWIDWKARRIDLRGQLYWKLTGNGREREPILRRCKYDSEREVPLWSGLAALLAAEQARRAGSSCDPRTGTPWREEAASKHVLRPAMEDGGRLPARAICGTYCGTHTRRCSPPAGSAPRARAAHGPQDARDDRDLHAPVPRELRNSPRGARPRLRPTGSTAARRGAAR